MEGHTRRSYVPGARERISDAMGKWIMPGRGWKSPFRIWGPSSSNVVASEFQAVHKLHRRQGETMEGHNPGQPRTPRTILAVMLGT